ncbi:hypothetical protein NP493_1337g00001 [Ridgeia piscesae]|uniref:Uncharacterized protein n=1 Tax=Ridgeia piscesae TaxID=27915 RepID=A0AAD9K7K9_RIDPI|nr:hypothetical protein NP493_1337g00001 [Ridgeia piscesae]
MIWKRWEMSAGLAGRRERPDTKRMNRMRSSLSNDSSTCQNHWMSWFDSSTSRYLTTFLRTSTDTSGIPQTICSRLDAVRRERRGTGTMRDIPSLMAAT